MIFILSRDLNEKADCHGLRGFRLEEAPTKHESQEKTGRLSDRLCGACVLQCTDDVHERCLQPATGVGRCP